MNVQIDVKMRSFILCKVFREEKVKIDRYTFGFKICRQMEIQIQIGEQKLRWIDSCITNRIDRLSDRYIGRYMYRWMDRK